MEPHQAAVRAFLAIRQGNPHEAEDLAQEAFVTAFRRLGDFRDGQAFGPWVRGGTLQVRGSSTTYCFLKQAC